MNKGAVIGIAVLVIAIIGGASYFSSESNNESPIIDDISLQELETEQIISEETEIRGNEFTVEFSEKIGLVSP